MELDATIMASSPTRGHFQLAVLFTVSCSGRTLFPLDINLPNDTIRILSLARDCFPLVDLIRDVAFVFLLIWTRPTLLRPPCPGCFIRAGFVSSPALCLLILSLQSKLSHLSRGLEPDTARDPS